MGVCWRWTLVPWSCYTWLSLIWRCHSAQLGPKHRHGSSVVEPPESGLDEHARCCRDRDEDVSSSALCRRPLGRDAEGDDLWSWPCCGYESRAHTAAVYACSHGPCGCALRQRDDDAAQFARLHHLHEHSVCGAGSVLLEACSRWCRDLADEASLHGLDRHGLVLCHLGWMVRTGGMTRWQSHPGGVASGRHEPEWLPERVLAALNLQVSASTSWSFSECWCKHRRPS
mmetsp:Transcript_56824/g.133463  ORF Transcript_56824/g.133463 Transcript_56824/m.133463 type:complete len:228 (+) Transcript_56824:1460-2143(+)